MDKTISRGDRLKERYAFSDSFTLRDGRLFCEEVDVNSIREQVTKDDVRTSAFFIYSRSQLTRNVEAYKSALIKYNLPYILGYSIKANYNPSVFKILQALGCAAVAVSGQEIEMAVRIGADPKSIIYNGNGKTDWEVTLAVKLGCILNIDSSFDLDRTIAISKKLNKTTRIILRLNPDINPKVHPYVATGLSKSKFGIEDSQLHDVLKKIKHEKSTVILVGLHCHLGSTIETVNVFSECVDVMLSLVQEIENQGFTSLKYLNLGGGLGINYRLHSFRTNASKEYDVPEKATYVPTPLALVAAVQKRIKNSGLTLILEPGRSLVGNSAILSCKVTGWKKNGDKKYLVVDGSMNEILRPSLYEAYHHIELTEPVKRISENGTERNDLESIMLEQTFDIVGPVCECADFLGKDRKLLTPHIGCGVAIFDAGAYCGSMAANYNMRGRPAEILVEGNSWKYIRKAETVDDILRTMIY